MAKFEKYPKRIVIYTHEIELEKVISKYFFIKRVQTQKISIFEKCPKRIVNYTNEI
jgi:hypothetical protein